MFIFAFLNGMLDLHVSTNVNHDDVTKWNHFRAQALCEGNPTGESWIPIQRPVTRSFGVFFDVRLNKRLSKRSRCRWFETLWRSLWRDVNVMLIESYAKQMKNKGLDLSPKVHYFSAFSVRKLDDGCRLLGVTKWNESFSLCKYIMISVMLRIVNPWTVPYIL